MRREGRHSAVPERRSPPGSRAALRNSARIKSRPPSCAAVALGACTWNVPPYPPAPLDPLRSKSGTRNFAGATQRSSFAYDTMAANLPVTGGRVLQGQVLSANVCFIAPRPDQRRPGPMPAGSAGQTPTGPSSFQPLCQGRLLVAFSEMFRKAISSRDRAIRSPRTSTGGERLVVVRQPGPHRPDDVMA